MTQHDRSKEAAKTARLASALRRVHEAYGWHTTAEAESRSRVLETTLARLVSALPDENARSRSSEQEMGLDTVVRQLLAAVPRSTDAWPDESRIVEAHPEVQRSHLGSRCQQDTAARRVSYSSLRHPAGSPRGSFAT